MAGGGGDDVGEEAFCDVVQRLRLDRGLTSVSRCAALRSERTRGAKAG